MSGGASSISAPRSRWQNPYVERLIGRVRRECRNHVIVLNERHPRRILVWYLDYYHRSRTRLSLGKDTPEGRSVQPGGTGQIVAFPQVGGLAGTSCRAKSLAGGGQSNPNDDSKKCLAPSR